MDQSFLNRLENVNARLKSRQDMAVLLIEQPMYLKELIKITNDPHHELALEAVWTIEQALLINPLLISDAIELFVKTLPVKHSDSNLRSIAKICSTILINPILKKKVDQLSYNLKLHMVECNFSWFTEEYRVAVKVHAMENLSRLCDIEEWILFNLIDLIKLNYPSETAAYQARARKLLKRLKKLN